MWYKQNMNLKRRDFLKRLGAASAACMTSTAFADKQKDKPNILFIFADDQCYETLSAFGCEVETPNLDKLVKRGVVFQNTYNMGSWTPAVCVASRAMLNSGRFLWNANNAMRDAGGGTQRGEFWSQLLGKAGYKTYMTGKWHIRPKSTELFDVVKDERPGMPRDVKSGYNRPQNEKHYKNGWKPWDTKHGGFWQGGKHWSEVVGDHGTDFLQQAAKDDKPFFMYLAFNAPHDPRQSPKEYVDKYPLDKIKVPENFLPEYPYADAICGKNLRDERLAPYPRTEYSVKVNRQEYYAIISHMDTQIGRILDALKKSGKADNTYIFFTADHGLAVGHHGLIGKQNMFEHSMRAPMIAVGPGIPKGKKIKAPVYLQDIMPTTLELANVEKPDYVQFQSLMPLINGKRKQSYEAIYGNYCNRQKMLRKGRYKMIHYPKIQKYFLYDLKKDPYEIKDLAENSKYAEKLAELKMELTDLTKKTSGIN